MENGQYQATFSTSALSASGSPYAITAVYGGDADNQGSPSNVVSETITKANAVIVITPYHATDDGNPHTATGTATGVETPNPANLSGLLNLSGTTHTDTGTYTDTWMFAGNGNYNSASGTITDVITQPLTVTQIAAISPNPRTTPVSTVDVTFSMPIDTSSPTAGAVTLTDNSNPVAVSGVSFALVPGTTSTYQVGDLTVFTAAAGSYTLTINAADVDDQYGNAGTGSLSTSWLVNGTTPTISWANPADIVYGTALSATQLDATANVMGTFTYTPAAGTILGAGNNQTLSVLFTPADTTDYTSAFATATINVSQATPTVVSVSPVNIIYGTALANVQLSGSATWTVNGSTVTVPGTIAYTSAAGTVLNASASGQSEAVTFTPTDDTTDYTTASSTATVSVAQATPTVLSVSPVNITYGTALANGQLSGSATWTVNGSTVTVPGTFAYASAAGTVLNASASGQSEAVTFTPTDDTTDYTTASSTATVSVAQATPTVLSVSPVNITYGTALANGQLSGERYLDRERQHRHGSRHLRLRQRGRNGAQRLRQWPERGGHLHAHRRHHRLHHGLVDRDRERRPGHANGGQRRPGEHHVRHGPDHRPAQRERQLDRERQHRHGARRLRLHQRGRNGAQRLRQWPERGGHLHAHRRHHRLHDGLVDRDRERRAGHANGGQRQPGQHHVRHGPGQRAAQMAARAGP